AHLPRRRGDARRRAAGVEAPARGRHAHHHGGPAAARPRQRRLGGGNQRGSAPFRTARVVLRTRSSGRSRPCWRRNIWPAGRNLVLPDPPPPPPPPPLPAASP